MGIYLNPGDSGFREITGSEYIDKTGLISLINRTIGTKRKLTCISRPRRFGKSYAAQMLCAYYDRTCDSRGLFAPYRIAADRDWQEHLNRYDVIYLDMTNLLGKTSPEMLIRYIGERIVGEIKEAYPDVRADGSLDEVLIHTVTRTGIPFVMIIDEWDAPIRETPEIEESYLRFLRMLFKSSGTTSRIFAAVYMTGILPIKKDGSQSAVSDFQEYTMLRPGKFAEFAGFTETEVRNLCAKHQISFGTMKEWYDGYEAKNAVAIYNPNSVMQAIDNREFDSYWTETSAAAGLMEYISKPYHGLTKTIAELIGGIPVRIDILGFANDLVTFRGRDDVLTLMIHLGYLAYDPGSGTVRIPNEEVKIEFQKAIRKVDHEATAERLKESEQLFLDTLQGNEEAVAAQIEKIHREETSPLHYHQESSLRSVIKLAYYTYRDHYLQWEELPAGEGYADIVYLPRRDSDWPALVIELKWNQSAEGAIEQIRKKKYPEALKNYESRILLVGISYQKDKPAGERKHSCRIMEA